MGSSSVTGSGQGSAEGPIRGLGPVEKILKQTIDLPAFVRDGQNVRSDIGGDIAQMFDVAKSGTAYDSVEDAITAINALGDASASNRYVIRVFSGIFTENPMNVPSFVSIQGINDETSIIRASNNNSPLFTMSEDSQLYNLGHSGPVFDDAIFITGGIEAEISECSFTNSNNAIHVDGVGTIANVVRPIIKSSVTTGILATDSGECHAQVITSAATNHIFANGGEIHVLNIHVENGTNAFYANNTGVITVQNAMVHNCNNVCRTGATGINNIRGSAINSEGSSTWDVLQETASGVFNLTGCTFLATNLSMVDASNVQIDIDSSFEGDEGHLFLQEVQVGSPEQGRETVMGEGDSYTRGMLVYTDDGTGTNFVNESTDAASASGSTFTLQGKTANNAIYVSSDLQDSSDYKQFLGIKASITVAAVTGAGELVVEYWDGAWTEFNHMSTLSNSPYTQYANQIFERTGSEQIRFQDLTLAAATWTKNDPPSTGTNRFWVRFRVATEITTAPIFEQFKVHSNRTEINADGFVEHMGKSRHEEILEGINLGNTIPISGKAPGNHLISYGSTIVLNASGNQFNDNAADGFGQAFGVPHGLDTSMPLKYIARWAPVNDAAAADVVLDLVIGPAESGLVLDGTNAETTISEAVTTTLNTADLIYVTEFEFYIPSLLATSGVFFMLQRQALGGTGPTGDTYGGNIYIVNTELFGYFWH